MEIAFSPSFKKAFKKLIRKNKSLEQKFWSEAEAINHQPLLMFPIFRKAFIISKFLLMENPQ